MELSAAHLRYLMVIRDLSQEYPDVSSRHVAQRLGVSKPAVKCMLDELMRRRLLVKARYGKVYLTDRGLFAARYFAGQIDCILAHFSPLGLELEEAERKAAAAAFVSALPTRAFSEKYAAVFGDEEPEDAPTGPEAGPPQDGSI